MGFRGWTAEAIEFYEGLEADNSKTYWNENKSVYENLVLRPMTELLAELAPEFGETKLFRPYRDVRFSADKAPYKTAIGATLELGGYVQLSAEGLAVGSGMWMMAPDQLERYREAVAAETTGQVACRPAVGPAGGRDPSRGPRRLEDGTQGLSEGPPANRAAALQGRHQLEAVAARPVARQARRQGYALSGSCGRHSLSTNGWANVGPSELEHWGRH